MAKFDYLRIGSLRCRIASEVDEYPDLLAEIYGATLESATATNTPFDLAIRILEDPRDNPRSTDRLTVVPIPGVLPSVVIPSTSWKKLNNTSN